MVSLFIELERGGAHTLRRQIVEQIRAAIRRQQVPPGARLPATRLLAVQLGVLRNVVIAAFEDLVSEGYLEGRIGSGTYVARELPATPAHHPPPIASLTAPDTGAALRAAHDSDSAAVIDFRDLSRPMTDRVPMAVWHALWRGVTRRLPPPIPGMAAGDPDLRAAVASYLARARGVACDPERVTITASAAHALDLLLRLALPPAALVAMEEPGCHMTRQVLLSRDARLLPVPVDDGGLRVDRLPSGPYAPALVYVTPAHQCPLGARMAPARRLALLAWAERNNSLIVEDDRGSEFLYDAPALPPLAASDTGGYVAYLGSFGRTLAPSMDLGYLVLPPALEARLPLRHDRDLGMGAAAWPVQQAFTAFLRGPELDRHVRRMRRQYAAKRASLIAALAPVRSHARLRGLDAGLHAWLDLGPYVPAARVIGHAAERGVLVGGVRPYYLGAPDRNGILLGYGGLDEAAVARGGHILAAVIAAIAGGSAAAEPFGEV
jgi:GntR family transcriptional regulator/MocR family aminotransferase